MKDRLFAPLEDEPRSTLFEWLDGYITQAHPDIGRDGAVCPFVRPSMDAESMLALSFEWAGGGPADMVRMIENSIELFRSSEWKTRNPNMHSLVVVVNNLPGDEWWLVDEGHRLAKDSAVAQRIMIGQFHPECDAPAVRNPLFPVNRSPFPLIALRNMAFHDILFLHEDAQWFEHYRKRYDRHYTSGAKVDPHFAGLYARAMSRWYSSGGEASGSASPRPEVTGP